MKKAKWIFPVLMLLLVFSSCDKGEGYFDDNDDFDSFVEGDDGFDDDFGDDDGQGNEGEGMLTLYTVQGDEISRQKDFQVTGSLLDLQQDYAKHQKMWEFTMRLIPSTERERITEFMVFFGDNDLAGYVEPVNESDLSKWRMGLAIDLADKLEEVDFENFFTYVTIHEYGHIATLNETQIDVQVDEASCTSYFPGEGCARPQSYINALYELGWADIYKGPESNFDYYSKYPDRFLTDYAASNPGEDIAEVFAYFVTKSSEPTGNTIAEKKVKLLYDYPELVKLRDQMRGNPTLRAMEPGSWKNNPYMKKYRFGNAKCKGHVKHTH